MSLARIRYYIFLPSPEYEYFCFREEVGGCTLEGEKIIVVDGKEYGMCDYCESYHPLIKILSRVDHHYYVIEELE